MRLPDRLRTHGHITSDFYSIIITGENMADVYLYPPGGDEYIVRGVAVDPDWLDELEDDIRCRYNEWLASAELL